MIAVVSLNLLTIDLRHVGNKFIAKGENSLNPLEIATGYLAVIGMATWGVIAGAPYAALENLLLLFPNDGKIELNNDFPSSSKKIQKFIDKGKGSDSVKLKYLLEWPSYCQDTCDHGFALNGGDLVVTNPSGDCQATVEVDVSYKPQYRASTLIASPVLVLRVDQAALHALQKLGYLYPYKIRYIWKC